jgi:hypothetical protein
MQHAGEAVQSTAALLLEPEEAGVLAVSNETPAVDEIQHCMRDGG